MRSFHILLVLQVAVFMHAQVLTFNFEDLSLTDWQQSTDNHWAIDTLSPVSGNASLHHNFDNSDAGYDIVSYCHDPLVFDSAITSWQFAVVYDYKPSGSNNWAFWIAQDTDVSNLFPSGDASGYVLGVNYKGTDDIIKLWSQNEDGISVLLNTSFNWQESLETGQVITFLLSRKIGGSWELKLDSNLSGKYIGLGTFEDTILNTSEQFGFYYEYTSSKDQLLWIDDVIVTGAFIKDTVPPQISSFETGSTDLVLVFSEEVDTNQNIRFILNNSDEPYVVEWNNNQKVTLYFSGLFSESNQLDVYNVVDLKGNAADVTFLNFEYYIVQEYDILISEILSDPSPQVDLPDCEYVELYNRSPEEISLKNWQFVSGSRDPAYLTSYTIASGEYLVLVDDGCEDEFSNDCNIMFLDGFPALPNSGETLKLLNDIEVEIHSVTYSPDFIDDEEKAEGGWSMEMVDPDYPCIVKNNWVVSESKTGGTPGMENSVDGVLDDYPYSEFSGVSEILSTGMMVDFSEPIDSLSACYAKYYSISPTDFEISQALPQSPDFTQVQLFFSSEPDLQSVYTLSLSENITDCSGISIIADEFQLGIPQSPDSSEFIINEILFEATDELPEFIELYNNSQGTINLKEISLVLYDSMVDTIKKTASLTSDNSQIFPGHYIVVTEDKNLLLTAFDIDTSVVIEMDSWISLVNDGGVIGLIDAENNCLDKAVFTPDMHFSLLSETAGVSLERIAFDAPGLEANSWHSAASVVDFATPGEENSQTTVTEIADLNFEVEPNEISPDNDGYNDYTRISYTFAKEGYSCSIKVFGADGLLERDLVNNELTGTSGFFSWDGLNENESRVAMGYHILLCEAWHPDGEVIKQKKVVLVLPQK